MIEKGNLITKDRPVVRKTEGPLSRAERRRRERARRKYEQSEKGRDRRAGVRGKNRN